MTSSSSSVHPQATPTKPPPSPEKPGPPEERTPAITKSGSIHPVYQSSSGKPEDIERSNGEVHALIDNFMRMELSDGMVKRACP